MADVPTLPPEHEKRLRELLNVFLAENAKLNLSAYRSEQQCWVGNVLDSLALLDLHGTDWSKRRLSIVDLGTGGGFPLLPLAIAMPRSQFLGIDATRKKVEAVGRIVRALELQNVELRVGRAEELGRDVHLRASFDLALARAVAPVAVLLEYCIPFLRVGGRAVFWKSTKIDEELQKSTSASAALSAKFVEQFTYTLSENFGERTLVIFEKTLPTPSEYPRGVGVAKAKPL